jgi:hypothetical protein
MVNTYYLSLLTVFAVVVVLIAIDPNVGVYIDLQLRNLLVQIKRLYYLLTIGTVVKYNNWKITRSIKQIRKERGLTDE